MALGMTHLLLGFAMSWIKDIRSPGRLLALGRLDPGRWASRGPILASSS